MEQDHCTQHILEEFKSICQTESSNGHWRKAKTIWKKEFHNFACWIKVPVKEDLQHNDMLFAKVLVFIDPLEKYSKRYITFEYNPSKISTSELFKLIRKWGDIRKSQVKTKSFKDYIHLRAVDLAIDVNRPIDSLTFFGSLKRYEETIYSNGLTRYLGARISDNYYCIYDKRVHSEQTRKKQHAPNDYLTPTPKNHLTRIEVRKKFEGEPIKYLPKLASNLFTPLNVSSIRPPNLNDSILCLFWELSRHIGSNAAYTKIINKKDKEKVRDIIKTQRARWWNSNRNTEEFTCLLKALVKQIK